MKKHFRSYRYQRGVAILLILLIFLMSASSFVLSAFGNRQDLLLQKQHELSYQMELAKASLLAYAANSHIFHADGRGPGFFPCPDLTNSGTAPDNCTGNTQMGRLPESVTVGANTWPINDYYAGIDEQFWYIVGPRYIFDYDTSLAASTAYTTSRHYSSARTSTTLSSATTYRLTLDGVTEYIALIIAPGEALSTQDRSSAPLNYSSYLDGQNGGSGYDFFTSYAANPDLFNDRVIGITLDEYMKYVGISAVREMKSVLDADHGGGSYVSGPSTPDATNIDVTGSQTSFRTLFNSEADWLQQSTTSGVSSDNERWTRWSVYITPALDTSLGGDSFSIKFRGCDMVFSAAFGSDAITRAGYTGTGDSC